MKLNTSFNFIELALADLLHPDGVLRQRLQGLRRPRPKPVEVETAAEVAAAAPLGSGDRHDALPRHAVHRFPVETPETVVGPEDAATVSVEGAIRPSEPPLLHLVVVGPQVRHLLGLVQLPSVSGLVAGALEAAGVRGLQRLRLLRQVSLLHSLDQGIGKCANT